MNPRTTTHRLLAIVATGILGTQALAQSQPAAATPPAAAPPPKVDWLTSAKTPTSWLSLGADLRIRDEYSDTMIALDEDLPRSEQNWIRFRARVWGAVTPVTNVSFNLRLTAEPREYTKPSYHGKPISGLDWTEGIIDTFNVKWKQAFGLPMTLTLGRQDALLGDYWNWWLVADGTPLDGSRTYFLDAARMTYELKEMKTTVDLFYVDQAAMNDRWLPPINHLVKPLTEQDERGVILYLSNKSLPHTQIDPYFIYKHDEQVVSGGDNADLYTLGAKITGDISAHWKYSVEGGYQFGSKEIPPYARQDMAAYGVNDKLIYLVKDPWNTQFRISHELLSGDDPNTPGVNEQWDLLWGRWPRWSELYIYSYIKETRPAEVTAFHRVGPGFTITPAKDLTVSADYNAVFAPETRKTYLANASLFGDGNFRGHYLQSFLKYKFSQHVNGHLWGEWFFAGDYYAKNDTFTFLRAEIYFTW